MFKFIPYIIRNVWRNKTRTLLTILGVAVAVAIFCALASLESSMKESVELSSQDTLLIVGQKDQY